MRCEGHGCPETRPSGTAAGRGRGTAPARRRAGAGALLLVLAVTVSAVVLRGAPLAAQDQTRTLDEGSFQIQVDGSRIGVEAFAIRREGNDLRAVGRITGEADSGELLPLEVGLQMDAQLRPQVFRLQFSSGELRSVAATREEGRMRVQVTSDAGNRVKEFLAPPELVVLEPRLAHHYDLLLRRHRTLLAEGGSLRVPVLVPSGPTRHTLQFRREGRGTVETGGGGSREAVVYVGELNGEELRVWAEPEGRILRVSLPGHGWTAIRRDGG